MSDKQELLREQEMTDEEFEKELVSDLQMTDEDLCDFEKQYLAEEAEKELSLRETELSDETVAEVIRTVRADPEYRPTVIHGEKPKKERNYVKMNNYNGIQGLINEKRNKNGSTIREWNAAQAGRDAPDGRKWMVECMTHNQHAYFATFRQSGKASAHPEEWCEECKKGDHNGKESTGKQETTMLHTPTA
jgi:hypothetical protein